jgi:hypothetical protein
MFQDNPVGHGTGLYNNKRLFTTKMDHAGVLPLEVLMRAEDFQNENNLPQMSGEIKSCPCSFPY